jgi:hypothetical protein
VTSAEDPLPSRDPTARAPSAWSLCPRCGGVVGDWPIHLRWHDVLEDRVEKARQALAVLPEQAIKPLDERITDIETQLNDKGAP